MACNLSFKLLPQPEAQAALTLKLLYRRTDRKRDVTHLLIAHVDWRGSKSIRIVHMLKHYVQQLAEQRTSEIHGKAKP